MLNLEKLKDITVLVVGDVMLDCYWSGDVSRISPEAPVPVVNLVSERYAPGGAANVAANIAGIGAKALLVGLTGNDDASVKLKTALSDRGIDGDGIIASESYSTTVKTRIIAHSQQVVRVDREHKFNSFRVPFIELESLIADRIDAADAVVLSDYAKGTIDESLIKKTISMAKDLRKPVFVDPKSRDLSRYYGARLITPNRREAMIAADLEDVGLGSVRDAGSKLMSQGNFEGVLITLGEDGMLLFDSGIEPVHLPARSKEVYDVTGAGDTVIAVISALYGAGFALNEAAELANIAAGIVVEQLGTTPITISGIRNAVENEIRTA